MPAEQAPTSPSTSALRFRAVRVFPRSFCLTVRVLSLFPAFRSYGPFSWTSTDGELGEVLVSSPLLPAFGVPGWENAAEGSPLSIIEDDELSLAEITVASDGGSLSLDGPGPWVGGPGDGIYPMPDAAPVYLSGSASDIGVAEPAFLPYAPSSTFGVAPSTNPATPYGLPDEEAGALGNMAQDEGDPDGVSRGAPHRQQPRLSH